MKILDSRQVEYAYVERITIYPNKKIATGFVHNVVITYDLKDVDKKHLVFKDVSHTTEVGETMDSVVGLNEKMSANFQDWVYQDKNELTGFTI